MIPQLSSSRIEVLTLERATLSVSAICSAFIGSDARNRSAWIWATVRLIPQRVPISPQWRMNWRWMSDSFVISVITEITEYIDVCQALRVVFLSPVDMMGYGGGTGNLLHPNVDVDLRALRVGSPLIIDFKVRPVGARASKLMLVFQ